MNNAMIEFRHVSKSFSRKGHPVLALQDINLSIERGDIFGIIGYSGAGKSTLLRLINRLETPGEGEAVKRRAATGLQRPAPAGHQKRYRHDLSEF
jgi:D-methionine transport system ATP-binding protein